MNTNKLLLIFALIFSTFASAQVGIGTQNPQGIFNIDGAKNNATSGAPTAAQQVDDFIVTSAGRVGIGTTSPSNKLNVNGNALFAPRTTNDGVTTSGEPITVEIYGKAPTGTATQVGGIKMGWYNSFGGIEVLRGGGSNGVGLGFNVAETSAGTTSEAMRIMFDGKVGIGTTAPAQKLDVNGTLLLRNGNAGSVFTTNQIVFGFEGNNTYRHVLKSRHSAGNNDQNTLDFYMWKSTDAHTADGSQHVMTLNGNGNVGIGTTTPATKLHVNSNLAATNTINANASMLRLSRPTTPSVKWDNIAQFNLGSYAVSNVSTNDANTRMDLALNDGATTSTNNVMTWQANGNVGIGTTAPASRLEVNGAATNTTSISKTDRAIDFIASNLAGTSASAGAFTLTNLKDGGAYTLAIKGTTSATCTFTATNIAGTALTVHLPTGHGATTSGKHTLYNFIVIGTDVYATWMTGL